jgi:hypothetical protein
VVLLERAVHAMLSPPFSMAKCFNNINSTLLDTRHLWHTICNMYEGGIPVTITDNYDNEEMK